MGTTALSRKSRLVPAWDTGLGQTNKGWASEAQTKASLDEVYQFFMKNREANGIKPNTKAIYANNLKKFFGWLKERGRRYWQSVKAEDVQDFVLWVREQGYAEATVHQVLRNVRSLFNWMKDDPIAEQFELKPLNKALPKLKKVRGRLWIPSPEELHDFMSSFDQDVVWGFRDFVIASLILDTGARVGEVCNMTLNDIKWAQNMVRLNGKTGERLVNIHPTDTAPLLRRWVRVREKYANQTGSGKDRVFITRNGGACTSNNIGHEFGKLRSKTGIGQHEEGQLTPHVLRHYFCTWYLANGGGIHNLQLITGHTELETLMIYVHMASELSSVKEEHQRVSPLSNLAINSGKAGAKKKRKMF